MAADERQHFQPHPLHDLLAPQFQQMQAMIQTPDSPLLELADYLEVIQTADIISTMARIEREQQATPITPIGPAGRRIEGIIFATNPTGDETPQLVKLFFGTGLDITRSETFINRVFPEEIATTTFERKGCSTLWRTVTVTQALDFAQDLYGHHYSYEAQDDPTYYPAAEILTRAVAHKAMPDVFTPPVALLDHHGRPVGFTVDLPSPVASVQDNCVTWKEKTPGPKGREKQRWQHRTDLHPEIAALLAELERHNVHVYNEIWPDLENQLLLNEQGVLIGIARLGYAAYWNMSLEL